MLVTEVAESPSNISSTIGSIVPSSPVWMCTAAVLRVPVCNEALSNFFEDDIYILDKLACYPHILTASACQRRLRRLCFIIFGRADGRLVYLSNTMV